jgi:hypothetical protein
MDNQALSIAKSDIVAPPYITQKFTISKQQKERKNENVSRNFDRSGGSYDREFRSFRADDEREPNGRWRGDVPD